MRHKVTRKLSSGQMTRLTLAKAVLTEPKILFLDEPTASLDPDIAHKVKGFLKEYRATSGLSMLYTSHNMREIEEMSDRIVFLQRGKNHRRGYGPRSHCPIRRRRPRTSLPQNRPGALTTAFSSPL